MRDETRELLERHADDLETLAESELPSSEVARRLLRALE